MKQMLLSHIKAEKLFSLKRSMTENSKNACWLLFSVILLTGTVTGIAGPLENRVRQMAEQTDFMRKETALYRAFAENQDYAQKQAQQRDLLEKTAGADSGKARAGGRSTKDLPSGWPAWHKSSKM